MENSVRQPRPRARRCLSPIAAAHSPHDGMAAHGPSAFDLHPRTLLLAAARQSGVGDPASCGLVLSVLAASSAVHRALGREIGFPDPTGARFAALMTLYARDPVPATAADLAADAEAGGSAIMRHLVALERRGWIRWTLGGRGPLAPINLTETGHRAAARSVQRLLQLAADLVLEIDAPMLGASLETCRWIESRAAVRPTPAAAQIRCCK